MTTVGVLPGRKAMPKKKPSTGTVRLDEELIRKARVVCALSEEMSGKPRKLVAFLDELVRASIEEQYQALMSRMHGPQALRGKRGKKGSGTEGGGA